MFTDAFISLSGLIITDVHIRVLSVCERRASRPTEGPNLLTGVDEDTVTG